MKGTNGTKIDRSGAGPAEGGATSLVSGLECRVGRAPVAIPVDAIAQIIEYQTSPLPLAKRWMAGMGLHDGRLVLTIGLLPERTAAAPAVRPTKAILFQLAASAGEVIWALEIHEVLTFVRATAIDRTPAGAQRRELPAWIARATTEDGRSIGWIDVPAMISDLTGLEGQGV
jgi:chemotaxis signal transduction protein